MTPEERIERLENRVDKLEEWNIHLVRWILVHAPFIATYNPMAHDFIHMDETTVTIRDLRDSEIGE